VALQRLARGEDRSILVPAREARRFAVQVHSECPVSQVEALRFLLRRPLERLVGSLDGSGLATRCLAWTLELDGAEPLSGQLCAASPSACLRLWSDLLKLELERLKLPAEVLSVSLEAREVGPRPAEQERLTGPRSGPVGALSITLAHLASELGERAFGTLRTRPALWPEDREELLPPSPRLARSPQPRLLPEARCSWVPDRALPGGFVAAFRRTSPAEPIAVELRSGRPVSFRHRGGVVRVERVHGPWDLSAGWWLRPQGCRSRRCFQVEGGSLIAQLYFELDTQQWFLAGWLD